jgi:MFS family permease
MSINHKPDQAVPVHEVEQPLKTSLWSKEWLIVYSLCLVGLLNYLDRTMLSTMRSSIVEKIPMSNAQFGLLTTVFLFSYGICSPIGGFLADRFQRSRVIIFSLCIWSVVTWLTSYVTDFNMLLLTRAVMGISEACYLPAALALITDYHGNKTRSLAVGIHMTGIIAGQSLGFLGGWLAEMHTWNYAFYLFGILGIGYALILAFFLKDKPVRREDSTSNRIEEKKINFFQTMSTLMTNLNFTLLLGFWCLLGIVGWLIMGWLPTYYQERFHVSQGIAGLYATGYLYPFSMVGVVVGGLLADRWNQSNKRARMLIPAIGLLIATPGVLLAVNTPYIEIAILGFMMYAFTKVFSDANLMPILCTIIDEKYRATAYGILNLFACVVGGIGIYAGGMLRDAQISMDYIFYFASFVMLLCLVPLALIYFRNKTEKLVG